MIDFQPQTLRMSGHGSSCGACKFLRRKCTDACVFAPFFCYEQGATHFAYVHKIFGASNVSKLLSHLPLESRSEAALSICYEAQARIRDPTYGCVAHIFALQQQVAILQDEIETLAAQVSNINGAASSYKCEDQYALGYMGHGFEQLPLQHGAMDLHQPSLEQQEVSILATCTTAYLGCDGIFYDEDNQEFDTQEKAAMHTLAHGCSTLSDGFISEQGSLGTLDMDMIQLEAACPTNCSFWSYSSQ